MLFLQARPMPIAGEYKVSSRSVKMQALGTWRALQMEENWDDKSFTEQKATEGGCAVEVHNWRRKRKLKRQNRGGKGKGKLATYRHLGVKVDGIEIDRSD